MFIQLAVGYNLVLPIMLFGASYLKRPKIFDTKVQEVGDYAVIVTAYQHTEQLPDTINSILKLNYNNYLIYIVADNCETTNLHFDNPRVIIVKPNQILASNTRSHLHAIQNFKRDHDRITIIDSDNLVHPEYLNELEYWFRNGFDAVQGLRKAKNLDTTHACLDAARDIYYSFYDGKFCFI